jgi:membrane-bound lytic murein transglycosylase B
VCVKKYSKSSIAEFRTLEVRTESPTNQSGDTVSPELAQMNGILNTQNSRYQEQITSASAEIQQNRARYEKVAKATGVPWELIGALHYREAG